MMRDFSNESFAKKMLRAIGPGTIAMLILVICIVGWQLMAPRKIQIERRVEGGDGKSFLKHPSAASLLSWKSELGLSAKQVAKLEEIAKSELKDMAPVELEIKAEMDEFDRWMKGRKSHSLAEIQSAAQPVSLLSRKKREVRWTYAQQAANVLDLSQKAKAQALQAARKNFGTSDKETGAR